MTEGNLLGQNGFAFVNWEQDLFVLTASDSPSMFP